jgi:hypothetical protein
VQQQGLSGQVAQGLDHTGSEALTATRRWQDDGDAHVVSRSRPRAL